MPDPIFIGWMRPTRKHPWQAVCGAVDEWACWGRLIAYRHPGDGLGVEKVVLPAGENPNTRKELRRVPGEGSGGDRRPAGEGGA